jgi:putative membrane protein
LKKEFAFRQRLRWRFLFSRRPNSEGLGLVHCSPNSQGVSNNEDLRRSIGRSGHLHVSRACPVRGEKSGINSALGITPKTEDFVKEAAVSDMFEIESSRLATTKGDAATKAFAAQMVTDHTKTSSELKTAVTGDSGLQIPTALDDSHQSKLDKLKGLSGADFAKEYRSVQVSAHKSAVSLFKRYADGGEDAKLKAWAAKTLPALQHHLEMAEALNKQTATN